MKKMVRDNICSIIRQSGKQPNYYIAETEEEYDTFLLDKMIEELEEFRENPCIEEAADMYDVLMAILERWDMSQLDVVSYASKKKKEKGGFFDGYILIMDNEEEAENDWDVTQNGEQK
jgi:predicted house-cleaning noncanonical NTP pyrophosphatase (MazG superfamily)